MKYFIQHFPVWHCGRCGRAYSSLENYCFFCKKEKPKEVLPPRHQYRDVESIPSFRRNWYEGDLNVDLYKE